MKKFIQTTLVACLLLCLTPLSTYGEGEIIVDIKPEVQDTQLDITKIWNEYKAEVSRFDELMPGDLIEENFKDEIRDLHPEYNEEALNYKETFVRLGVRGKRIYEQTRSKVMKFLADEDLPLNLDDNQFATADTESYQEADTLLVVQDFKKIVAYSKAERDQSAAQARLERQQGVADSKYLQRQEMKEAILSHDWKKVFTYGLFDGKEIATDDGLGPWAGNDKFKARIYTTTTAIGDGKPLKGALHIWIAPGNFLLFEAYEKFPPLKLTFENSVNLADIKANWPVPVRISPNLQKSMSGYAGSIFVPLEIELKDANQPLQLKAQLKAQLCGNDECNQRQLAPTLEIKPGVAKASKIAPYLQIVEPYAPRAKNESLRLTKLVAESNADKREPELLRAEFKTTENPSTFDVFISSPEGIRFARPLIRIDGHKVVARFRALDKGELAGKNFVVSARLQPNVSVRNEVIAESASLFDMEGRQLSLGLIWLGFLGGFLLNLMPCVFPVLSLKIMSFTRFGTQNGTQIRIGALFNLLGIFTSFALLTASLIGLKLLGRAVGWGMQFQNVYFLTFIIFIVAAFLAHVWGIISFKTPQMIEKMVAANASRERLLQFLTGLFLVLLSTPCTAPYLGTALGFALAGSAIDIVIMMTAVGLGLSVPYVLLAMLPELVYAMPKPGPWIGRVNFLMATLLVLTLVWLLSILYAQTSSAVTFHFILFLIGFWMVLWFRKLLMEVIETQPESPKIMAKVRRFFNVVIAILLLIIFVGALLDARYYYQQRRQQVENSSITHMVKHDTIKKYLSKGQIVLVRVGADWCLTCVYNNVAVFNSPSTQKMLAANNVMQIDIDWTRYNPEVLQFMEQYGRRGLPFYVIFSPRIPEGMVLPEIMSDRAFSELIENLRY